MSLSVEDVIKVCSFAVRVMVYSNFHQLTAFFRSKFDVCTQPVDVSSVFFGPEFIQTTSFVSFSVDEMGKGDEICSRMNPLCVSIRKNATGIRRTCDEMAFGHECFVAFSISCLYADVYFQMF
ncbi:unknown [Phocaeicola coprophilus CAG:333]|nr:unknown [Phocaeicola coprophilus CAG:333]